MSDVGLSPSRAFGDSVDQVIKTLDASKRVSGGAIVGAQAIRFSRYNQLRLRILTSGTNWGLTFRAQFLGDDAGLSVFEQSFVGTTLSTGVTRAFNVPPGFLVGVSIQRDGVGDDIDQIYVIVEQLYGAGGPGIPAGVICSGYLTRQVNFGWPGGYQQANVTRDVPVVDRAPANPAGGAQFSLAMNNFAYSKLESVKFRVVTSVTAATRQMYVDLSTFNGVAVRCPANGTQTASLTRDYFFSDWGAAPAAAGSNIFGSLPDVGMSAVGIIATSADNFQAGAPVDAITAVIISGREIMLTSP